MGVEHRDVVTVGASAGGVEALRALTGGLPPDYPGTLLVVPHMPRDSPSALPAHPVPQRSAVRCPPPPSEPARHPHPGRRRDGVQRRHRRTGSGLTLVIAGKRPGPSGAFRQGVAT
ncbi:chemotaxis protein CheB [Jidongwangia harbinensis]|uniref:chemotaxis protein CheB n=1 Tax=Jidongwangia harbinensis TaxID=2878561 RepID=UPI001CDA1FAA|nr:chemotaxis protein CheB [Jidongwangia harbinensis]MCA2218798.1 hypothetical protein [Jidongwangia harbinensis]